MAAPPPPAPATGPQRSALEAAGLGVGMTLDSQHQCLTSALPPTPVSFVSLARDEFNIQVLHAFVELHEFTDLNLVQALR